MIIDLDISDIVEYQCEVQIDYTYTPYRPGNYSGYPEDCYEAEEEELYINKIMHNGLNIMPTMHEDDLFEIESTLQTVLELDL